MKIIIWLAAVFLIATPIAMLAGRGDLATLFFVLLIICILIPIRRRYGLKQARRRKYGKLHGSAKFADSDDIDYYQYGSDEWSKTLALGWMPKKNWVNKTDPRYRVSKKHVLTLAPTGSGKGVGCVIPTLLEYQGNIVCLDIKGENWAVTHAWREKTGHYVVKLDPFNVCGGGTDGVDVISWLRSYPDDAISDALLIADSFVVSDGGGKSDHWDESAKALLQGLLVYASEADLSLSDVRDIVCKSGDAFIGALKPMLRSPSDVVRRCAESYSEREPKEVSGILSTAIRHTAFLDERKISKVLNDKDGFSIGNLRWSDADIYLIIPPERVGIYGRYIRLILTLCLTAISRIKSQKQVLFLLDEVCQLGRLEPLETAISLTRGYEAFLWLIVQDLSQLRGTYRDKWGTFFSNSVSQFFGTADYNTAQYLSDSLGNKTEFYTSHGTGGIGTDKESDSESETIIKRELMTAGEIMAMAGTEALIFCAGKPPAKVRKLNYLTDHTYKGAAAENPMHQK